MLQNSPHICIAVHSEIQMFQVPKNVTEDLMEHEGISCNTQLITRNEETSPHLQTSVKEKIYGKSTLSP